MKPSGGQVWAASGVANVSAIQGPSGAPPPPHIFNEMKIFETEDIKVCEVEVWESETSSAVVSL